jgi:integrase
VLSPGEVVRLLDAAPGLKYKAALSVAYGAGLHAAEVVALKVSDIDSKRMLIRVEQGKGLPAPGLQKETPPKQRQGDTSAYFGQSRPARLDHWTLF